MRRSKITLLVFLSLIIIFFIISIIIEEEKIFFIPLLIIIFCLLVFKAFEFTIISEKTKPLFEKKDYIRIIDYLENKINNCYFLSNEYASATALVMSYMLVDDTEKAKNILVKYKKIQKNKLLLYIQMIILISENKLIEAWQYKEKLFHLNNKKYRNQKESATQIFEMIERSAFNSNLYNNTKFPLVKTICLRYNNGEIDGVLAQSPVQSNIVLTQQKSGNVRFFSVLLNVLTFFSLFFSLLIVSLITEYYNPITSMDGLYYLLKNIWIFWLLLPLSIGCIVFGMVFRKKNYKTTSNIIIGIIFSLLLFMFGLMHFLGLRIFNTDSDYLIGLGEIIDVDFPSDITIVSQDWTTGKQTSSDNNYYKYTSVVRFNNDTEILSFKNNINDDYWVDTLSGESIKFLPFIFTLETLNYDRFLLYCFETDEYNPKEAFSKYNYLCIAYSKKNNCLIIYEFSIK